VLAVAGCAAVAAGVGSASAQTTGQARHAAPAKEIIIGMPIALTGALAAVDNYQRRGAELAIAAYNAKGGVLGSKLKLVFADTRANAATAANAADAVIAKGAQFLIPTPDYDFGGPAARQGQSKNIISISGAGDPRFGKTGLGSRVFNVHSDAGMGAACATFAYDVKKWRRAYVITDASQNNTKSATSAFTYSWGKLGGKVSGTDTFQGTDAAFPTQVTRLKQAAGSSDFIWLSAGAPAGPTFLKQLRAAGIDLPVLVMGAMGGTWWTSAVSVDDLKNVFAWAGGIANPYTQDPDPIRRDLFKRYQQKYKQPPEFATLVLFGYAAVESYVTAIRRAKSTDSSKVAAQLERFRNVPTAMGAITWTPSCHITSARSAPFFSFVTRTQQKYIDDVKGKFVQKTIC
jgi:branched-chain amino acid transport system substrate-binding protein